MIPKMSTVCVFSKNYIFESSCLLYEKIDEKNYQKLWVETYQITNSEFKGQGIMDFHRYFTHVSSYPFETLTEKEEK